MPRSEHDKPSDRASRAAVSRGDDRGHRDGDGDGPVLPTVSQDETGVGWGDEPGERDDEWYRRERPPHHG